MIDKLNQFISYVKSLGGRIDFDGTFGYQCNDLTRAWLKHIGFPQYKPLGANGVKLIAANPNHYLPVELKWIVNNKKDPNQVPKVGDIVIFSIPSATGHIAVVHGAPLGINQLTVYEQNAEKGSTTGRRGDSCQLRVKTYRNILGRISCNS